MVTSTKKARIKGVGSGSKFPGPNGKKPGGNGFKGGDRWPKFSPATYRITMWFVLAAIVMMFAALSVGYIYLMSSEEPRQPIAMPRMFLVSTGLILVSSAAFERARRSLHRERTRTYIRWLLLTLALGFGFIVSQLFGWRELSRAGVYFSGHPRSTFFYLATALHAAHLVGGIGLMFYLAIKGRERALPLSREKNSTWTSIVGLYWHTMGGIWLWLFLLLPVFK
jgi:cytochrome c oxidase subunit 3